MDIFRTEGSFLRYINDCYEIFVNMRGHGKNILDVGAGFGLMSLLFEMFGAREVLGLEIDAEKIEIFDSLCDILHSQNTSIERASALAIPHLDSSFGVVSAIEILSHVGDLNAFLLEVRRVLRPRGILYAIDTNNGLSIPLRKSRSGIWKRAEEGPPDVVYKVPFREIRRRVIQTHFPSLNDDTLNMLVKETEGMWGDQIIAGVEEFRRTGRIANKPGFHYRDPITGVFPEFPFNPYTLGKYIEDHGFEASLRPLPPYVVKHPWLHKLGQVALEYAPGQMTHLFYNAFPKFEILAEKRKDRGC